MRRLSQVLTCLLLCLQLCGGTLGVLQVVAWTGMAITYSRDVGVVTGIKQTFDGEHPCDMCRSIAKTRESEQEKNPQPAHTLPSSLLDWAQVSKHFSWQDEAALPPVLSAEVQQTAWPEVVGLSGRLGVAPPTPPPRWA